VGYFWPKEEEEEEDIDSDDEEGDPYEHPRNKKLLQLGRRLSNVTQSTASISTLSVDSSSDAGSLDSDIDLEEVAHLNLNDGPSPAFFKEIKLSLERAFLEDHSIPNALLELKTLVMGYNSGIDPARKEVVDFIMERIAPAGGAAKLLSDATAIWERWGGLATSLCRDPSEVVLNVQVSAQFTFLPLRTRMLTPTGLLRQRRQVRTMVRCLPPLAVRRRRGG
jgi:translation initiation factor eIF-2B subunit epsilon